MATYEERNEPGFDPGPDEEDAPEGTCAHCDAFGEVTEYNDEDLCADCCEGAMSAAADCRAERRAERRHFACDLGIGPSDGIND
jgi:hypothetical protein